MVVNGEKMNFEKKITVEQLLQNLNIKTNTVVVEVDLNIIPKEKYSTKLLGNDSKVELITFVGGG